jgi:hypothetical protein
VVGEVAVLTQEADQLSMETCLGTTGVRFGFAAPRSHGSLPTQCAETHAVARVLRLVSVSQADGSHEPAAVQKISIDPGRHAEGDARHQGAVGDGAASAGSAPGVRLGAARDTRLAHLEDKYVSANQSTVA